MRCRGFRFCAFLLVLVILPGVAEVIEGAVHLVTEGHLAHAAPNGDHHEPVGSEHGCTAVFHVCACHASLAFLSPARLPGMTFRASLLDADPGTGAMPLGFWPAVDRPPRA